MTTTTPNYGLTKPDEHAGLSPSPSYHGVFNGNLDTIDTLLKARADSIAGNTSAIAAVAGDVATAQNAIASLVAGTAGAAIVSTTNTFSAVQTFDAAVLLKATVYLDSATAGWQIDHTVGSTSIINIRAKGAANSKSLIRMMPQGTGESATTGDRTELTFMFEDIDLTNRGWVDFKVRDRPSDGRRYLHVLTDRNGTGKQADEYVFEMDPQNIVSTNEFAITRDAWVDQVEAGSGGAFMFRLRQGTGITRIEPGAGAGTGGTIQLATGNLVLGTDSGDVVIHSTGALRPWADGSEDLGSSGLRWNDLFFNGVLSHSGASAGFYGTTPIAKPTGVAVTAAGVHAALVSLGLIAA